jgi:peptide/nickel transport system substrate-binding protein
MAAGRVTVLAWPRAWIVGLVAVVALGGCAPASTPGPGSRPGPADAAPATSSGRTLVLAGRAEIPSLASKPLRAFGLASSATVRLFSAGLTLRDGRGESLPYLAESLPQLNTDSWRLLPDGRMETTYRLRADITWHDGTPLSAEDWVFALQVYSVPEFGHASSPPVGLMEGVEAPDARTLVIRWKQPYVQAGALESAGATAAPSFPALPRHVLAEAFAQGNSEAFIGHPYWSTEFVGLGPFRLDRWERGSFLEAVAFPGHALGRPKIDRLRMLFIPDFNAVLANLLSGEAHMSVEDSIRFQQGQVLRREWGQGNAGTVLAYPQFWRWTYPQLRAELAQPQALRDVRVRRALAHAIDRQALSEALFEGEATIAETSIPPTSALFSETDRVAVKQPYDPRRTEQLMGDTGWVKGADGIWSQAGQRFGTDLAVIQSPQNENEMAIMAAGWRQLGFDIREVVWPAALSSDAALRNQHPGLATTSGPAGEATLVEHRTRDMPTAQNRWTGANRGGWSNEEYDRSADALLTALDRPERQRLLVQMVRVFTEDVAVYSLYFAPTITAFVAGLSGPQPAVPESTVAWNIHEWEFR